MVLKAGVKEGMVGLEDILLHFGGADDVGWLRDEPVDGGMREEDDVVL